MANETQDQKGPKSGLTPHVTILDGRAAEAIDFYKTAFGAEEAVRHAADDGKRLLHVHLLINGGSLMLNDDFPEFRDGAPISERSALTLHLQTDDADAWFDRAVKAGASVAMPLEDAFWGDRYGQIRDPFGNRWSIGPLRGGAS